MCRCSRCQRSPSSWRHFRSCQTQRCPACRCSSDRRDTHRRIWQCPRGRRRVISPRTVRRPPWCVRYSVPSASSRRIAWSPDSERPATESAVSGGRCEGDPAWKTVPQTTVSAARAAKSRGLSLRGVAAELARKGCTSPYRQALRSAIDQAVVGGTNLPPGAATLLHCRNQRSRCILLIEQDRWGLCGGRTSFQARGCGIP